MHATYPSTIQHHPGWFGAFIGALAGALLTLGLLVVLDRVDLTVPQQGAVPAAADLTPAEMMQYHWIREHPEVIAAERASRVQAHFAREHQADLVAPTAETWGDHFAREHAADLAGQFTLSDHFAREHAGDISGR